MIRDVSVALATSELVEFANNWLIATNNDIRPEDKKIVQNWPPDAALLVLVIIQS